MKIAIIGDLHFRLTTPPLRIEKQFWEETVIPKWNDIIETIKQKDVKTLICTGDIFDSLYNVSFILIHKIINLFQSANEINIYSIYGNHDLSYYENINYSPYNILLKLNIIKQLNYLEFENVNIYGENYNEILPNEKILKNNKKNILITHSYILPPNDEIRKYIISRDLSILNNFDLVIAGHYHKPSIYKNLILPGIVYRVKKNEENYDSKIVILDTKTAEYELINIKKRNTFIYNKEVERNIENEKDTFTEFIDLLIKKSEFLRTNHISSIEEEIFAIKNNDPLKNLLYQYYKESKYEIK